MKREVAGFVLAGGKSSRMGQDKALLMFDGETLVERGLRKLGEICGDVAIAGGAAELSRFARLIPDAWPGCGPLGGIVAALEQSAYEWNLFLPVDMPFVPVEALRSLPGGWASIYVPRVAGVVHPLCGAYSRAALPVLRAELEAARCRMTDAIEATLSFGYVENFDPAWLANVNTPEDLAAAKALAELPGSRSHSPR
jgi:molybdopterin-guanine dinucleotide biosynthesis protein A